MNKKELLLIGAAVVVVIIIVVVVRMYPSALNPGGSSNKTALPGGTASSTTRADVPSGTKVPEAGAKDLSSGVAAPKLVTPAAPGASSNYRSFDISVQGGKFTPDTVIVNQSDTVHLNLTAADKDYDFYQPDYGLSMPLPKGQAKMVEFGATLTGKLTFYCQSCGGPAKGPVGYVVVVPLKK